VEERVIERNGIKVNIKTDEYPEVVATVNVAKTIFHCFSIVIISSLLFITIDKINLIEVRKRKIKKLLENGKKKEFLKDYNNALKCYEKAVALMPLDPEAWYLKGNVLLQGLNEITTHDNDKNIDEAKSVVEAIKCFNKVIELNPNYKDVKIKMGYLQEKARKYTTIRTLFGNFYGDKDKNDPVMIKNMRDIWGNEFVDKFLEDIYKKTDEAK
jgi:tetratricopeptide (TPR) repeat protein